MILSGTALADEILALVKKTVAAHQLTPRLAVVQVGSDPASDIYVRRKLQVAQSVGIEVELIRRDASTTDDLEQLIDSLNERPDVNAILVQMPLPASIDADRVVARMAPQKDVDGFHPANIAAYTSGRAVHTPVLIQAVEWLLGKTGVPLADKHAVIIGKSDVFLQPLSFMLGNAGARVSWTRPPDIDQKLVASADVLIVAVGSPRLICAEHIKQGAIVIDIGINRTTDGKVCGDVDVASVQEKAAWITPTPGGVGPVTIAALMWNTLRLTLDHAEVAHLAE